MKLNNLQNNLQPRKIIVLALLLSAWGCRHSWADSITLSETWVDNTSGGVYSGSTDTGTFNASLTIPGLSSMSANDWSNLVVTINSPNLTTGEDSLGDMGGFSDFMADAPTFGGSFSATSATFFFQLSDTNDNSVDAYEMTFSWSGNTFTISGQTLNPPAVQPPWSILAENYLDSSGAASFAITDQASCEVVLQNPVAGTNYADIVKTIYITGSDTISYDSDGNELNDVSVSGAADYTPPTLVAASPRGALTTTNDFLTVQVRATDSVGVANVEFYLNGMDYGPGVAGEFDVWSANFALLPGLNTIWTQATDAAGNNSATNVLSVTYVNEHTTAGLITFAEQWLDSAQTDSSGDVFDVSQDVGSLNAAWLVSGLQSFSANTWSNLVLSVSFGNINFSSSLTAANVLTSSNAVFYLGTFVQLSITRSGNTLILAYEIGNPTDLQNHSILAGDYLGLDGLVQQAWPLVLSLQDGITQNTYANISQPVYVSGTDTVTHDADGNALNHVQLAGAATLTPPTLTAVSPTGALTTTNDLLTVQVKATDAFGVTNVEYYVNHQDYGSGVSGVSNLWSMNFALLPGTNLIQTVATDAYGSNSALHTLAVTYVDKRTNANSISFSEHWLDSWQSNSVAGLFDVHQDVGTLNAALLVPGLKNLSAGTWSNLVLTVAFGDVLFTNSLANANILTASNAIFYVHTTYDPNRNLLADTYLSVARASNTLVLAVETGNPTYAEPNPIIADSYFGYSGSVQDARTFALLLQDGNTLSPYAKVSQTVYISGTDTVTYDPQTDALDNVQISGAATFRPPTLTVISPAAGAILTNGLVTVKVRTVDNYPEGLSPGRFEFFLNGRDFGPATPGASNLWTMNFVLAAGSNTVRMVAADIFGNNPATNTLQLVYVNRQTNANLITFEEHWLDSGLWYDTSQDTGLLDAALAVPGLKTMPANIWSNLSLTLCFGNFSVAESLSGANVLTTNQAVFYFTNPNDTIVPSANVGQLSVSRAGNTLLIAARVGNPTYLLPDGYYFLAANYLGVAGPIQNAQPFVLTLQDGITSNWYANVSRPVFIAGSNSVAYAPEFVDFNNLQISGAADFLPPTNTITSPVNGQRLSTALCTVTGKARDNVAVSNVLCSVNGGAWFSAVSANHWTNWTAQVRLSPGTNVISAFAVDTSGNVSLTNSLKVDVTLPMTAANVLVAGARDVTGNVPATKAGTLPGVTALTSLAGYAATVQPSIGNQEITFTWGDGTYSQAGVGSDTNANDYGVGGFEYFLTDTNTAVLVNLDLGMLSWLGTTNFTAWNLTFTSATTANYAWTNEPDSGTGTMTFTQVSNMVPASLGGTTIKIVAKGGLVATATFGNDGSFSEVEASGAGHAGTYAFTPCSSIAAMLQLNYSDPSQAGAVTYAELSFTSAAAGALFESFYASPSHGHNPDHTALGTFTIAPTP